MFNRYNDELKTFELRGCRYQEIPLRDNRLWLPEVELGIGLWSGTYQNINRQWLRWYNLDHQWMLTPAEQEAQRAEQEYQRAERLARKLRELGINPDGDSDLSNS